MLALLISSVIGLSLGIPAPGTGALEGYCDTSAHCAVDECCVSFNQPRGKRTVVDVLDPNLMRFVHGSCRKLGTNGSVCYVNELRTGTDGLHYDCACASGYVCKGSGMHEVPKGERGACELSSVVKGGTLNQMCTSGADCSDTECCLSYNRPIGKRSTMHGHCSAMGASGSGCLVKMGSGKPDAVVYSCPCYANLTCHGTGIYDVPLGEMGRCGV